EASLKERLALNDRLVKTLEKGVFSFLETLHEEPTEKAQHHLETLLISLNNYKTTLERHPPIQIANEKEISVYEDFINNTVGVQSQAKEDIVSLREELSKAQKVRNQKLEYDRVARDIMKYETRNTYKQSIDSLQDEINLLEREKARRYEAYERRKLNLSTLVNTLTNLQQSVEEERNNLDEDQRRFMDMERGYVSSDDEGDMNALSDNEDETIKEEEPAPAAFNRFQDRRNDEDDEDDEEGIVLDTPMTSTMNETA
ncbi:hypothetical protein BDF20DRAFT_818197, partial [Mycotypha africana]|uniref:uncharacterized protein n=1 Tax=Mycotypha africana TaxID=64632 RepID=UPI0023002DAA